MKHKCPYCKCTPIHELSALKKMNFKELAKWLGMTPQHLSKLAAGKYKIPKSIIHILNYEKSKTANAPRRRRNEH